MINSITDYTLDKTELLLQNTRENSENRVYKYHYNSPSGVFKKSIFFTMEHSQEVYIAITAQCESQTSVVVESNGTKVVNENFSNYVFINQNIQCDNSNNITVSLNSENKVSNINILIFGKILLKNDDFIYDFKQNSFCHITGEISQNNTISAIINSLYDRKHIDSVKNLDCIFNFGKNQNSKNNLISIYDENNFLKLKDHSNNKIIAVDSGVNIASLLGQNREEYGVCYHKGNCINFLLYNSSGDVTSTQSKVYSDFRNISAIRKISSLSPTDYVGVISDGYLYILDCFSSGASPKNLCKADDANLSIVNGKLYIFAWSDGCLFLHIFNSTNFVKEKSIQLKNYTNGFAFNGKLYAFNSCTVDEIVIQ